MFNGSCSSVAEHDDDQSLKRTSEWLGVRSCCFDNILGRELAPVRFIACLDQKKRARACYADCVGKW